VFSLITFNIKKCHLCRQVSIFKYISNHSQIQSYMCEIMSIERLNFDLSTWSFQIHDTFCQLNDGAFSMDPTNQYIYSQAEHNAYTLFGTGALHESTNQHLTKDTYCILLTKIDARKRAFLVHSTDFYREFIPNQFPYSL
jgi:hypothetical protein